MAPGGLMMMLFAPVSSRLMQSAGAKRTLVIGAAVLGSGYVVAAFLMHTPCRAADRLLHRLGRCRASGTPRCPR